MAFNSKMYEFNTDEMVLKNHSSILNFSSFGEQGEGQLDVFTPEIRI